MTKLEWICQISDSYEEAYDKISKVKHNGEFIYHYMVLLLTNKKVLKSNLTLGRSKFMK